jgi:hypothetical protein
MEVGWDSIATKSGTGDSDAAMHKSASLAIMVDSLGVHHTFSAISCRSSSRCKFTPKRMNLRAWLVPLICRSVRGPGTPSGDPEDHCFGPDLCK